MKTSTMNGQAQSGLGKVYFLVCMLQGVSLGQDMRRDFPANSCGTRNLERVKGWKNRFEAEHPELRGELHIMATPSFVLDESAPLEEVL